MGSVAQGRRGLRDAKNVLAMSWTWQNADLSANPRYGGDFQKALGATKAKAIVMPCVTDLYFTPEDSEAEVAFMPNAEFRPIRSIWGHLAGGPGFNPEDATFVDDAMKELLAS